ncbi:hypothetical protein ACROYT_G026123 [Oculina patagonica]
MESQYGKEEVEAKGSFNQLKKNVDDLECKHKLVEEKLTMMQKEKPTDPVKGKHTIKIPLKGVEQSIFPRDFKIQAVVGDPVPQKNQTVVIKYDGSSVQSLFPATCRPPIGQNNTKGIQRTFLPNQEAVIRELVWYLSSNRITSLPDGVFANLTNLDRLDLSSNQITSLTDGVFANLRSLRRL